MAIPPSDFAWAQKVIGRTAVTFPVRAELLFKDTGYYNVFQPRMTGGFPPRGWTDGVAAYYAGETIPWTTDFNEYLNRSEAAPRFRKGWFDARKEQFAFEVWRAANKGMWQAQEAQLDQFKVLAKVKNIDLPPVLLDPLRADFYRYQESVSPVYWGQGIKDYDDGLTLMFDPLSRPLIWGGVGHDDPERGLIEFIVNYAKGWQVGWLYRRAAILIAEEDRKARAPVFRWQEEGVKALFDSAARIGYPMERLWFGAIPADPELLDRNPFTVEPLPPGFEDALRKLLAEAEAREKPSPPPPGAVPGSTPKVAVPQAVLALTTASSFVPPSLTASGMSAGMRASVSPWAWENIKTYVYVGGVAVAGIALLSMILGRKK